jgi:arsenate reductase
MMHGYLKKFLVGKASIYSAGIETHGLNKGAVAIMAKDGIDISMHTSNHVDEYADVKFDYMITVCDHANENCPYVPGVAVRLHHNFTDPSKVKGTPEEIEAAFTSTRDAIKEYAMNFVREHFNK